MSQTQILVIDDIDSHLTFFAAALRARDYDVLTARSSKEANDLLKTHSPKVAIVDLVLQGIDGIQFLKDLSRSHPAMKTVAVTAFASVEKTVGAMRAGAVDFLVKPVEPDQLHRAVEHALGGFSIGQPDPGNLALKTHDATHLGSSDVMQSVATTIHAVAGSGANVFITGESGTGKTKSAEMIHALSGFGTGPFVKVDCSTVSPELIETELFGKVATAEDAAMTGAVARADGGTLFLDEICALQPAMQARLLNLLQRGALLPRGAVSTQPVKFRLICATSLDAHEEVRAGKFRADLFYRLNVVPIYLPPLRERGLDVIELAETALKQVGKNENTPPLSLSTEVKALFLDYAWPGNIRELINVIWNISVQTREGTVTAQSLPAALRHAPPHKTGTHTTLEGQNAAAHPIQNPEALVEDVFAGMSLADIERRVIEAAISREKGSIPAAARALQVSPSTIYRKLESWGQPARGGRKR